MTLRPYQVEWIGRVQQAFRTHAAVLGQLPTGGGKTHTAAVGVIAPAVARGRRVLFLADLEEIVLDTVQRLRALEVPAAAILAGRAEDPTCPVQVASLQTLQSWQRRSVALPPADRVILDECHGSSAACTRELLAALRTSGALLLGLTATPARGDGQALDEFSAIVQGPQPAALVRAGALVPCEVLAPAEYLSGVAADPVDALARYAPANARAVIFAQTGAEAERTAAELTLRGQPCGVVLDSTPTEERRQARARLASGSLQHLATVRALQKGFDAPLLDTAVLTSAGTITGYLQMVGRVLRASPNKRSALVLDLRGASILHGLPLDDREWTLDGRQGPHARPDIRVCRDCHATFPAAARCPRCGSRSLSDPRPIAVQHAELRERSGIPLDVRAREAIAQAVRNIARRRPDLAPHQVQYAAEHAAPQWVRTALNLPERKKRIRRAAAA